MAPLPVQRQSGALVPAASVRHISHRRFLATFPLVAVGRSKQDLYRCVSQAPRGAGVSNFAELIVKGEPWDACGGRHLHPRGAGRAKEGAGSTRGRSLVGGVAHGRVGKAGSDPGRCLTEGPAYGGANISPEIKKIGSKGSLTERWTCVAVQDVSPARRDLAVGPRVDPS